MLKNKVLRKISAWMKTLDWEYTESRTSKGLWFRFVEEDRDAMKAVYYSISAVASFCGLHSEMSYCSDGAYEVEVY